MSTERPDYLTSANDIQGGASMVILCKLIADVLDHHYPDWLWVVRPDAEGGIVAISSLRLSGTWCYTWRLRDLSETASVAKKQIIRGGGEYLERFGCKRGKYNYDDWAAINKFAGLPVPDVSDKSAKVQQSARVDRVEAGIAAGTIAVHVKDTVTATGTHRQVGLEVNE